MLEFDRTFMHSYEVEEVGEFPGTGKFPVPQFFFPRPKGRPEHNGMWLKVTDASARTWIGIFAFGPYPLRPAFSRVFGTPDPYRMCVISNGEAYLVKADEPEVWEDVRLVPVLDVRAVPEKELLILSDYTRLAALGSAGLAWRSPRVCYD